jgi:hypothetical protein
MFPKEFVKNILVKENMVIKEKNVEAEASFDSTDLEELTTRVKGVLDISG